MIRSDSRCAYRWRLDDGSCILDRIQQGLDLLYGIDARHGMNEPYLFDDEQISGWRDEVLRDAK